MPSPFLTPGLLSQPEDLSLLFLRRDMTIPTVLRTHDDENLGYNEGKVVNTRFGSFPHSTLINQPWGSQVIASKVDTGSRGRKEKKTQKRKADELDEDEKPSSSTTKTPVAASSGFLHLLYPTPELWTTSLPHRTQVVYSPDYSYILERLRARPGCTVVEAGAGSGSFTHAAARAVFNGYPEYEPSTKRRRRLGKVCSFEFHQQRAGKIQEEIKQHGLDSIVQTTHRDVYEDGFLLGDPKTGTSPKANAVFLDLPAPWLALKHLVRRPSSGSESPLDPSSAVHVCTFSPCLEQVQRTISALRQLGWLGISMVEVQHRRIDVKREVYGLDTEGVRGAVVFPKSVDEAISKLRAVEERARWFREQYSQPNGGKGDGDENAPKPAQDDVGMNEDVPAAEEKEESTDVASAPISSHNLGRVTHRSELDMKTHTSYLIFAVLPREWSEEDELKCRQAWPTSSRKDATVDSSRVEKPKSKKQMKREAKEERKKDEESRKEENVSEIQPEVSEV